MNNRGTHADKGGEFAVMATLMLHNHMLEISANQQRKHWESLYSTPVAGRTALVIGMGTQAAEQPVACNNWACMSSA